MADTILASAEARLIQAQRALGSPGRAEQEKRDQKSCGEHWGVALPKMDVAARTTLGDLSQEGALALCRRLWHEPVVGPQDCRGADSRAEGNRARRQGLGLRERAASPNRASRE
jgi:hypothetical protein